MLENLSVLISQMSFIDWFNVSVFAIFTLCYSYQIFYVLVVLTRKRPEMTAKKDHKFAVLIAARNERTVIGDLITSIKSQNYPQELIDVYVIADNCTDDTAAVARENGATVFTRNNPDVVGKGYALDYGLKAIWQEFPDAGHEAYFVFDADNVLDKNYFREMNKTFDSGAKASTSYRNSKNFDSNWISSGYAIWFLREAKFLNQARITLNTSCTISGTGFFISADILRKAGGWKWHLLTEDIEFSASSITDGLRISYCPTAMFYDEQPTTFKAAWHQRFRWAKGFYQVFGHYALGLAKGMFTHERGHRFACFDMLMTVSPCTLLTVTSLLFNTTIFILGATGVLTTGVALMSALSNVFFALFSYFMLMFVFGVLTIYMEWDKLRGSSARKLATMITFPLYMFTYLPIAVVALFKKAKWTPIAHTISVDVSQFAETRNAKVGIAENTVIN